MKRSVPFLFLLALVTLVAIGCGSSSSSDSSPESISGFYSVREPEGGAITLMRGSATGVASISTLNLSIIDPGTPPTFFFNSSGAAYDSASKSIIGSGSISDIDATRSVLFKVGIETGTVSPFAESTVYDLLDPVVHGGNLYVFSALQAGGERFLLRYPLVGGPAATPVALNLGSLYPGEIVTHVQGSVALDGVSGKAYLLLVHSSGSGDAYSLARVDLATGAVDANFELGSSYVYGNLFLAGSDLFMTREDSTGVATIAKVPKDGGAETLVSTLNITPLLDAAHNALVFERYTLAADAGGNNIVIPAMLMANNGIDRDNLLVMINVTTGAVTKLDATIGCYYMHAYVP